MPETDQAPAPGIYIDGVPYNVSDLTYGEQRELRKLVLELAPDSLTDMYEADDADFVPAVICVIKRRTDPDFSINQALEIKPADHAPPGPPTKRAAKKKAATT
jgi:hypothetical protein